MPAPIRVKICGVTTVADSRTVAAAGADAVGLNFYARSPRHLSRERAHEIAAAIPASVLKVGVFVDVPIDEIRRTFEQVPLDLVQLHGNEPDALAVDLGAHRVIRAVPLTPETDLPRLAERIAHLAPYAVLIDATRGGQFGGTGARVDWEQAAEFRALLRQRTATPLLLAGGLRPENIAAAIRAVLPDGVDTASGVESAPGQKDESAVRTFVASALAELTAIASRRH